MGEKFNMLLYEITNEYTIWHFSDMNFNLLMTRKYPDICCFQKSHHNVSFDSCNPINTGIDTSFPQSSLLSIPGTSVYKQNMCYPGSGGEENRTIYGKYLSSVENTEVSKTLRTWYPRKDFLLHYRANWKSEIARI